MNERIRELLIEAHKQTTGGIYSGHLSEWTEKFAQLIVKECAKICINDNVSYIDMSVMHQSGKFTVQDLATKSCGENLAKRIKEHFGVEE